MLIHSLSMMDRNSVFLQEQNQETVADTRNRDKTLLIQALEVIPLSQLVIKGTSSSYVIACLLQVVGVTKAMKEQWS